MSNCKFRKYHWHDGFPDYLCEMRKGFSCENSYYETYSMFDCKMLNETFKKRIEKEEKELIELKEIKEKLYESLSGNHVINGDGQVYNGHHNKWIENLCKVGRGFDNKEKAEKARNIMVKHDIILKYVIDHEPDYEPNWNDCNDYKYSVVYHSGERQWIKDCFVFFNPFGMIVMPEWVAEKLADDLNNNRINLTPFKEK